MPSADRNSTASSFSVASTIAGARPAKRRSGRPCVRRTPSPLRAAVRHTASTNLLHAGVDITVIALWLGHESPTTTRVYPHADMALKEKAIARTTPPNTNPARYQPPDTLLTFLDQL